MPRSRGRARATRIERGLGAEAVADLRRRCPPGPVGPGAAARVGRPPSLLRHGSSRNNRAGSSEAFVAAAGVLWLGEARLGAGQGRRRRRLNEAAALPAFLLALLFGPVRRWHFTLRRPPSGRCAMDHHAIAVPSPSVAPLFYFGRPTPITAARLLRQYSTAGPSSPPPRPAHPRTRRPRNLPDRSRHPFLRAVLQYPRGKRPQASRGRTAPSGGVAGRSASACHRACPRHLPVVFRGTAGGGDEAADQVGGAGEAQLGGDLGQGAVGAAQGRGRAFEP